MDLKKRSFAVQMSWSQQSPVDLSHTFFSPDLHALTFEYANEMVGQFDANDHDNFHVDPVDPNKPVGIIYQDAQGSIFCPLIKMHFHKPSEHTINGKAMDFEAHLMHKVPSFPDSFPSSHIVVGIFFDEPQPDKNAPKHMSIGMAVVSASQFGMEKKDDTYIFSPSVFLPHSTANYYRYEGSLTSAPYTESISWFVLKEHNALDTAIEHVVKVGSLEDARSVQPLNRRFILRNFDEPASAAPATTERSKHRAPRKTKARK